MTRPLIQRLDDILDAARAIDEYAERFDDDGDIAFDAVRARLIDIGEAVKGIPDRLLQLEPDVPWRDVARMRDHLTHRYFDTAHSIIRVTATIDVPLLARAIERLKDAEHRARP